MGNVFAGPAQQQPAAAADAEAVRAQANAAAQHRRQAAERSQLAYQAGDHAGAKYWSQQAKNHAKHMTELNQRAASLVYAANNRGRPSHEVDLHGLRVAEAIAKAEAAVAAARQRGDPRLVLIVGRGRHSVDGVAKLKPAIIDQLVDRHSLRCTPGVPNEGCVLVELVAPGERGWLGGLFGGGGGEEGRPGCAIA